MKIQFSSTPIPPVTFADLKFNEYFLDSAGDVCVKVDIVPAYNCIVLARKSQEEFTPFPYVHGNTEVVTRIHPPTLLVNK